MKDQRPVYLNLFQYRFPATAIISILHRASGFLLFLLIPFLLWLLDKTLHSAASFNEIHQFLVTTWFRWVIWISLAALLYHLVAGVRHLLMDIGIGESKCVGRFAAYLVMLIAFVLIILTGIWLW